MIDETIRPLRQLHTALQGLVRGRLWLQVLVGLLVGAAVGVGLGPSVGWVSPHTASLVGAWLALPGHVFLALVQMVVVPLVMASIVLSIAASENLAQLRRLGLLVSGYFVLTTAVAIVIGMGLAWWLAPGSFISVDTVREALGAAAAAPAVAVPAGLSPEKLPAMIVSLLPSNPLGAMIEGRMLHVVLLAVITGVALAMMSQPQAQPLLALLASLQEVCMTVVRWAMWLAPLAVFGLLAQLTARTGVDVLIGVGAYVGTVLLGLLTVLAMYLLLVMLIGRTPAAFMRAVGDVQLLAFSTSSSAAVMPMSIRTAEDGLQVRPAVARFVVPLGATINMNGTALYQGVATVFLAQAFGIEISLAGLALVVLVAVGASIGSPGTPGVGIVILAMVLATVGIPPEAIALIMGVDRILDMSRTAVNVTGDLVACLVMDKVLGNARSKQPAARFV